MAHWLIKSEPNKWSWQMQVEAGEKGTFWNGVRNHLAKQHLMAMKTGDQAFFYHSNEGKEIVGIVKVIKPYYPERQRSDRQIRHVRFRGGEAFEDAGDARCDQSRRAIEGHDSRQ